MFEESPPSSPDNALVPLVNPEIESDWQPIFHASNQVVLYNPTSHALSIAHTAHATTCPYCNRPFPQASFQGEEEEDNVDISNEHAHAANYFQLLAMSNEISSRPASPPGLTSRPSSRPSAYAPSRSESRQSNMSSSSSKGGFTPATMAQGYFARFFKEERRLGMGANGTVYLCQHILDNNPLGHFAVKKIAVGDSHSYLLTILQEIRLLERLHHPNIITYHHAWLEMARFSTFGVEVPTLHLLMQYASGGSLDDFIATRLGDNASSSSNQASEMASRSTRIRAFREKQRTSHQGNARVHSGPKWKAVHLLSAEEIRRLFGDVVEGLAFLHGHSILHLDLKPGNVLLTYDDSQLIPRAMLSDFGTSRDMLRSKARSGNTGTLEYSSPESLPSPQTGTLHEIDSKSDIWSLGMLLHKMLFFRLPYRYDTSELEGEILGYTGFKSTPEIYNSFESRHLPRAYLYLLEKMLHPRPSSRPACDKIVSAIRDGRFDPLNGDLGIGSSSSLVPAPRRSGASSPESSTSDTMESHHTMTGDVGIIDDEPSTPRRTSIESHTVPAKEKVSMSDDERESTPLLGLPPVEVSRWGDLWLRMVGIGRMRIPRVLLTRTIKSTILIVKIMTFTWACSSAGSHPIAFIVIMVLAIVDTWFDGYRVSVVLGALHIGLTWLACRKCLLCT
ncbi:kinase-like protein [Neolentinus lepideus HHB14362 ss-1]|uniref:non-specific serine/threonine protein kinase n=1 Tax=Neolentinus lepideus HHB14362 ss-1 TaxID=1314782 RepID=A0A165PEN0_9AGAM|nr:kinase-like protein [Neolentinus lepideus HHB14362 ss-1]